MKIKIVAVGSLKQRPARELCDDYLGRLAHYCACEQVELKPAADGKLVAAIRRCTKDTNLVALDVGGERLSSKLLAKRLEGLARRGKGNIAFLIGGADGLPKQILDEAHARWSLSALTFPHRLARVILAEQLYRAMTILRNEPYDR